MIAAESGQASDNRRCVRGISIARALHFRIAPVGRQPFARAQQKRHARASSEPCSRATYTDRERDGRALRNKEEIVSLQNELIFPIVKCIHPP